MPKRPRFSFFNMHYQKVHRPGCFALNILNGGQTPSIYPHVQHNYQTRDRNTLWITMMGNTSVVRRTVRSAVVRKMRAALNTALAEEGYASDGRVLGKDGKKGLTGSLEFTNFSFMRALKEEQGLRKEMQVLVRWLVDEQKIGQASNAKAGQASQPKGMEVT